MNPAIVKKTSVFTFSASHRLSNPCWDEEKNREVFGPCANKNWHGHNFILYITFSGPIDPLSGLLYHHKELDPVLQEQFVEELDYANLNEDIDYLKGINPTCEYLVLRLKNRIEDFLLGSKSFNHLRLSNLFLQETEKNAVELVTDYV